MNSDFNYFCFDLETYYNKQTDSLGVAVGVVIASDNQQLIFNDFSDFFGFLKQTPKTLNYVFAHNFSGFDGYYLLCWLLNNYQKTDQIYLSKNNLKENKNKSFSYFESNNKIYSINVCVDNKVFIFKCTKLFFSNLSIEMMGNLLGIKKYEDKDLIKKCYWKTQVQIINEYGVDTWNKYVEYCINDVVILKKYLEQNNHELIDLFTKKINTISSCSFSKFKNSTDFEQFQIPYQLDYNAYFGGYCIVNNKFVQKLVKKINKYDINSSYPFIMTQPIPYHKIKTVINNAANYQQTKQDYLNKGFKILIKVRFYNGCLKKHLTPIIFKKTHLENKSDCYDKHLTNLNEYVANYYQFWIEEWNWITKFYKNLKYYEISFSVFKADAFLKDYVDNLYVLKQKADGILNQNPNDLAAKITRTNVKYLLNNLYGKFGQKPIKKHTIYVNKNNPLVTNKLAINDTNRYIVCLKKLNQINAQHDEYDVFDYDLIFNTKYQNNHFIASYITCGGRIRIYEQIFYFNKNFVYCDTDSIVLKNKTLQDGIISNRLGDWKLENTNSFIYCIKPKQYLVFDSLFEWELAKVEYKIAGFNNLKYKDFNDFISNKKVPIEVLKKSKKIGGIYLENIKKEIL